MVVAKTDGAAVVQEGRFHDPLIIDVRFSLGVRGRDRDHPRLGVGHHTMARMDERGGSEDEGVAT